MINFDRWQENRNQPGTIEFFIRHVRSSNYQKTVDSLKPLLLAEMFIGCGCNATLLSKEVGVHRNTIYRVLNEAGLSADKLRDAHKKTAKDGEAK